MTIALWTIQILLAALFLFHGLALAGVLTKPGPLAEATAQLPYPEAFLRLIGWAEALAAPGLLLPGITGILPVLTPLAALGLVVIMLGATSTHLRKGELAAGATNLGIVALCAFVAYGRLALVPLG